MNVVNKKISAIGKAAKKLRIGDVPVNFKSISLLQCELKAAMLQLQYDRIDERLDRTDKIRSYTKSGSMLPINTKNEKTKGLVQSRLAELSVLASDL